MCSSPKSKSKVKGKGRSSGTLLSNMSSGARSRFAERANLAQNRREKMTIKIKEEVLSNEPLMRSKIKHLPPKKEQIKSLIYWLVKASIKEIFIMLFLSRPKRV